MPYRLESKKRADFDQDMKPTQWKPHFPLGIDEQGKEVAYLHMNKAEIRSFFASALKTNESIFDQWMFRIVTTSKHGDTAVHNIRDVKTF